MATIVKTIVTSVDPARDYSTMQAWEDDLDDTDIYSADDTAEGRCYKDSDFGATVLVNGGATVGLLKIILTAAVSDRHDGTAGTGVKVAGTGVNGGIITLNPGDRIMDCSFLEICNDSGNNFSKVGIDHKIVEGVVRNSIIHNLNSNNANARGIENTSGSGADKLPIVFNNIIYKITGNTTQGIRANTSAVNKDSIYNNTVFSVDGTGIEGRSTNTAIKNNIAVSCGTDFVPNSAPSSHNLSSDTTAPGDDSLTEKTAANQFVSIASGSEDLHLKTGADAIGAGTNLSATFTDDIDGDTRPSSPSAWCIGADEFVAAVVSSGIKKISGVAWGSIKKVSGVSWDSIKKVAGVEVSAPG